MGETAMSAPPRVVGLPWVALAATGALFILLFSGPAILLARDWWTDPEAGHGLLLFPAALWLLWKQGFDAERAGQPVLGLALLFLAVGARLAAELAAELFILRASLVGGLVALVVFHFGLRQLRAWWLPFTIMFLAIPLPELIRSSLALPLQFQASQMGTALLEARQVDVVLDGNIIRLPSGHRLFVTEACSGLRSLTALISLSVLMGGLSLRSPWLRGLLVLLAIPVAVLINGVRVFMTGFLVHFVDPSLGEGFMHLTEGWLLFLVSFLLVGLVALGLGVVDRRLHRQSTTPTPEGT